MKFESWVKFQNQKEIFVKNLSLLCSKLKDKFKYHENIMLFSLNITELQINNLFLQAKYWIHYINLKGDFFENTIPICN